MAGEVIERAPAGTLAPSARAGLIRARRAVAAHARRNAAPYAVAVLTFGVYLVLSLRMFQTFLVPSYDLAEFEQAVRSMAAGQAPQVHLEGAGVNAFALHFFPVIAVLVPIYWLTPTAVSLLVAQDLLVAASAYVVTRTAVCHVRGYAGVMIGLAYAFSWGLQAAVAMQFHEVAFALPLVAASLAALIDRRWWTCALWAAPMVFVKEDQALTVVVIAFLIALRSGGKRWAPAAVLALWALVWVVVAYAVMSRANGGGWIRAGLVPWRTYADPLVVLQHLVHPGIKLWTLADTLAVTGFLALRSPLTLAVVPTFAWRFLADRSIYWGSGWHYDAVPMAIVFVAMIDALVILRTRSGPSPSRTAANAVVWVSACLAVILTIAVPGPVAELFRSSFYRSMPVDAVQAEVLRRIPPGVVVESDSLLEEYLTGRDDVYGTGRTGRIVPDYVLHEDTHARVQPDQLVRNVDRLHPGADYVPVFSQGAYVVLRRSTASWPEGDGRLR